MRSFQTILENDLFSFRKTNEVFKDRASRLEKENSELQAQLALEKTRSNEVCSMFHLFMSFPILIVCFSADCSNG